MKRLIMNDKRGKKDMAGTVCEVMFHAFDALAVFVGNTQVFANRNDVELVERKRKEEK